MAVSHKLFGKPTSAIKEEEEARAKKAEKKAQKAQKKATREAVKKIDPNELQARLEAHPEVVQKVQSNEELMSEIQKNPMILIQMLDEADKKPNGQATPKKPCLSPALQDMINRANAPQTANTQPQMPQTPMMQPQAPQTPYQNNTQQTPMMQPQAPQAHVDPPVKSPVELFPPVNKPVEDPTRVYIPSSAPVQKSSLDMQHDLKINTALAHAHEAERFALESIGA